MEQKQYEDMATIMQFSRIFVDAMRRAMQTSGLLDNNYELNISIHHIDMSDVNGFTLSDIISSVDLHQSGNYKSGRMTQYKYEKEGWLVCNDPVVRTGVVPPEVRTYEKARGYTESRKTGGKESPPDGLWISAYPDNPVLDSWESLK